MRSCDTSRTPAACRRLRPWMGMLGVVALACSTYHEGIQLDVGAEHDPGDRDPQGVSTTYPAGQPRGTTTDLDYGVVLQQAYVTVQRLEIVPCDESRASLKRIWEWLSPVSVAHAHAPKTPMRMVVPHVLNLLAAEGRLSMSRLRPPPGRYCDVDVVFGVPDADARGLPENPDMVGGNLTAFFAGEVSAEEHGSWDFEIPVGEDRSVRMPLVDDAGDPLEVRLDEDQRNARLTLHFGYGAACPHAAGPEAISEAGCSGLLDGIAFATGDDGSWQLRVMDNLLSNLRAEACAGASCDGSP